MKVFLGLVHNNGEHVDDVKSNIEALKKELLDEGYEVTIAYSSYQPIINRHTVLKLLKRRFDYFKLGVRWNSYRNGRNSFRFLISAFIDFLKIKNLRKLARNSLIETYVTDKHLRLWFSAIEESDFIVVFEDDVIFKKDSIDNFKKVVSYFKISENDLDYFDLAGGLPINILGIDKLKIPDFQGDQFLDADVVYYNKIVTNTACGYMISRETLESFISTLIDNPHYRYTGIDWLINRLAMHVESKGFKSVHFNPPLFNHGSFTGEHQSWQSE